MKVTKLTFVKTLTIFSRTSNSVKRKAELISEIICILTISWLEIFPT